MRETSRFNLSPLPADGGERQAILRADGAEVGLVPGAVLEAQYETAQGTLLFVTHEIPFEEQLDILLLDDAAHIAERVSLYGAYTTGAFEAEAIIGPDTLRFRFFGGPAWQARLLPQARWRWPFSDPPGVHRARTFSKRIEVRPVTALSGEQET